MDKMIIDNSQLVYNTVSLHAITPDGTIYTFVLEDSEGKPKQIKITIGKAGTAVAAWADALESMINISLLRGTTLEDICVVLKDITTDKSSGSRFGTSVNVRSGPEGLYTCLFRYIKGKKDEQRGETELTKDVVQELDLRTD
jgi:hypothetical protein